MNIPIPTDEEFALLELLSGNEDLISAHPWVWEGSRWKELVLALVIQVANVHRLNVYEEELREFVELLDDLHLLDVQLLAHIKRNHGNLDETGRKTSTRFLKLLQGNGFSEAAAQIALAAISEAAMGLEEHHDGKVQLYLRHYGEMMLSEVKSTFPITSLPEANVADAFTYWLQNVVSMPLSLIDSNIQRFCKEKQLDVWELLKAADRLGLSVGLLDDLVQRYVAPLTVSEGGNDNAVTRT
jgi:hypothetical protein